jgi:hypothetical protein
MRLCNCFHAKPVRGPAGFDTPSRCFERAIKAAGEGRQSFPQRFPLDMKIHVLYSSNKIGETPSVKNQTKIAPETCGT